MGGIALQEEEIIKFPGVVVDQHMSWKPHLQNVICKINKQCGILYLNRNNFDSSSLKQLYYSLAYPHIAYCHTVSGKTGKIKLEPLEKSQKKFLEQLHTRLDTIIQMIFVNNGAF